MILKTVSIKNTTWVSNKCKTGLSTRIIDLLALLIVLALSCLLCFLSFFLLFIEQPYVTNCFILSNISFHHTPIESHLVKSQLTGQNKIFNCNLIQLDQFNIEKYPNWICQLVNDDSKSNKFKPNPYFIVGLIFTFNNDVFFYKDL